MADSKNMEVGTLEPQEGESGIWDAIKKAFGRKKKAEKDEGLGKTLGGRSTAGKEAEIALQDEYENQGK